MARHPLRLTAALTVAAAAWGLGGCGGAGGEATAADPPAGPPFLSSRSPLVPPPAAATPVPGSADAVALAAVTASLSWDTRVDRRPNDTVRRLALGWLTPQLQGQVTGFAGQSPPGAEWEEWSRRHAHATVTSTLGGDERPADTASVAHRQVHAAVTLHGDGGWTAAQRRTLFLRLARVGGQWRVDEIVAAQTS